MRKPAKHRRFWTSTEIKKAVVLHVRDGLSFAAIAERLGRSEHAVAERIRANRSSYEYKSYNDLRAEEAAYKESMRQLARNESERRSELERDVKRILTELYADEPDRLAHLLGPDSFSRIVDSYLP